MERTTAVFPQEDFFVLSSLPPSPTQKRLALAVTLALLITFLLAAGPFSRIATGRVAAFVPAYTTALVLSEGITAFLLFSQFAIFRTQALLVISCGYVFAALMAFAWMLTYPGVFGPTSLVGGLQSTPYIHFFWHIGFPIFVIAYALLKDADPGRRFWKGTVRAGIALSVTLTASLAIVAAFFFIADNAVLPRLQLDPLRLTSLWLYLGVPTALVSIFALILLWTRWRSVLDLCLMVVMSAYAIEISLSYFPAPMRYSFGWYAGRVFGLLSSSLVLWIMLYEITTLYARLLLAVRAQRREREARLMTGDTIAASIAHEVQQPLSGMITSADAGLRFLNRSTPDLDEAKGAFEQIVADGHRAAAVIKSIRTLFKTQNQDKVSFDVNKLIEDTLALVQEDLQKHRITVERKLHEHLLQTTGDRIQLQQVLLNLMTNAIDSMAGVGGSRILSVQSGMDDDGGVSISVADTGEGVGPLDTDRIFNPLFTTKPKGMGMGLSICRAIVEAHNGRLWVSPNAPRGAVFHTSIRYRRA